jgi:P-type Ca2+ transporter type 2C
MCTGDNPFTAKKIATDCGILQADSIVMEGPEFRALTDEQRMKIIPKLHVLARSSPQDKYILVQSLKRMDEVVAVTGDGTNDAPALREANIGFAMGIQGTDVAKNASDIVLLDDRFDSILQALLWGRNAYAAICKFLQFQFAINLTSCLITLIAACANVGTPLNAVMVGFGGKGKQMLSARANANLCAPAAPVDQPNHGHPGRAGDVDRVPR